MKDQKRCKVGELRPSQALTTFGIGSIIDLPHLSVIPTYSSSEYDEMKNIA